MVAIQGRESDLISSHQSNRLDVVFPHEMDRINDHPACTSHTDWQNLKPKPKLVVVQVPGQVGSKRCLVANNVSANRQSPLRVLI